MLGLLIAGFSYCGFLQALENVHHYTTATRNQRLAAIHAFARFVGEHSHNKWAWWINDQPTEPIWSGRSEVVERLQAQQCELCGSTVDVAVHHVRRLADLQTKGQKESPK